MIGLENRGETLFFTSRHFDKTMTILISQFLLFGDFNWWLLCVKNKWNNIFQKMGCFIHFRIFPALFPQHYFPHSLVQGGVQMAYR